MTAVETQAATCLETGYEIYRCADCGYENKTTIPTIAHSNEVLEEQKSTCSSNGYQKVRCHFCGLEKRIDLPLAEHLLEEVEPIKATVSVENGKLKIGNPGMLYICSVCGKEKKKYNDSWTKGDDGYWSDEFLELFDAQCEEISYKEAKQLTKDRISGDDSSVGRCVKITGIPFDGINLGGAGLVHLFFEDKQDYLQYYTINATGKYDDDDYQIVRVRVVNGRFSSNLLPQAGQKIDFYCVINPECGYEVIDYKVR